MSKRKRLTIRLDPDLYKRVAHAAINDDVPMNDTITAALERACPKLESEAKPARPRSRSAKLRASLEEAGA